MKSDKAYEAITQAAAKGETIAPSLFSHFYGRAATSAAFRRAKKDGVIIEACRSVINTPIYRRRLALVK